MAPDERKTLASLYAAAIYEVDLATGALTFVVGPNPHQTPPFVIITAYNPGFQRPPPTLNAAAHARLNNRLTSDGRRFVKATGRAPDACHAEPSFAVFDVTIGEAIALARDFAQAAIFVWDGTNGSIAWCDEEPRRK